jgi:hypothetical protein
LRRRDESSGSASSNKSRQPPPDWCDTPADQQANHRVRAVAKDYARAAAEIDSEKYSMLSRPV